MENPKPTFLKDWCWIFNLWKTQNLPILKMWETFQTLFILVTTIIAMISYLISCFIDLDFARAFSLKWFKLLSK